VWKCWSKRAVEKHCAHGTKFGIRSDGFGKRSSEFFTSSFRSGTQIRHDRWIEKAKRLDNPGMNFWFRKRAFGGFENRVAKLEHILGVLKIEERGFELFELRCGR
jgi:hypothetical protein